MLFETLVEMEPKLKQLFIKFITGCEKLPIGGLAALSPKLTVARRIVEGRPSDECLPTVMTCQNYLKIPEYSSYNILEKKILMAMNEGCNEFNLS